MSYISPINCENKENWDLLRILLSVVVQDEDGALYLNTSGGGGTAEATTLNTSLVIGDNVFLLAREPSIVQVYTVDLAGMSELINVSIRFIGTTLTINSAVDVANVNINYI